MFNNDYYMEATSCYLQSLVIAQPFQPVVSPSSGAIAGWMSSTNPPMPQPAIAPAPPGFVQPSGAGEDVCDCLI